jgi:CheY-like chemotaxis protein
VENKVFTGRHILIVEDEMMILILIEEMLADLGFASVSVAATVEQALALIDAQFFDAAMLDVNLNGSKSYPVAEALAARRVPFLFATGYSDHGLRDLYHDRPLLKKPYKPEELVDGLEHLLS